ncbi:MAG: hypothetical protein H6901_02325 [Rhodobacteraceae bacterium]|nr:hypothetical protein [Paracoccaceae bacterium]MCP5341034.1 hypothetical protein [Paracoccaceae bacterium]
MSQMDINATHHDGASRQPMQLSTIIGTIVARLRASEPAAAPRAAMTDAERREARYRIREQGYLSDVGTATDF